MATVYFDDGTGERVFDVFRGDQTGNADIEIAGTMTNVRVELSDGYDEGANNQDLNILLSDANACTLPAGLSGTIAATEELHISIFPNPAIIQFMVNFSTEVVTGNLFLSDILGNQVGVFPIRD